MKKEKRILVSAVCLAVLLVIGAGGTATAAIVPFNGIDSSWLHSDSKGQPTGDWLSQINDNIAVRQGDAMQFQNRYYNNFAGTADVRISYGGGQPYVCAGAEEYLYYGLNFGNYYPSGTASVPLYSSVSNCSEEPNHLIVNHQYVYNGFLYGCFVPAYKWTMRFHEATPEERGAMAVAAMEHQNNTTATAAPAVTPTAVPMVSDRPTPPPPPPPTPGFDSGTLILLACVVTAVLFIRSGGKKR
jgi:hypothetical protein